MRSALSPAEGDAAGGARLFEAECTKCHSFGDRLSDHEIDDRVAYLRANE